jgi:rod shape-determining protein MreD
MLLALLLAQIAWLPNMPSFASNINIILVVLIFISVVYEFYMGVVYGLFLGVMLDLYSALPFGAMILSLMITLYLVYKIFQKVLTNKSFYTLLGLTAIGTIVYSLILYAYLFVVYFSTTKDMALIRQVTTTSLQGFWWQLVFNLVSVMVLFFLFHVGSRRFKTVFIDTTKT